MNARLANGPFELVRFDRFGPLRLLLTAAALLAWMVGSGDVLADNTRASASASVDPACGGDCPTAQVDATFVWAPADCVPSCTVYTGVASSGLCSSLLSIDLHIPDGGDDCLDADVAPFPIDVLAGPFVFTNAELQGLLSGAYMLRATLSDFCDTSGGDCLDANDCNPGEACLKPAKPKAPVSKSTPPPPPPLTKPFKMHFPQRPDELGWDVLATDPQILADDWLCTETGFISGIHFWGSWLDDIEGNILAFDVRIYSDVPGSPSTPGTLLWQWVAPAGSWTESRIVPGTLEGWYDPSVPLSLANNHANYFRYDLQPIPDTFFQFYGTIYWLAITAIVEDGTGQWGWKSSIDHFNDAAVWRNGGPWLDMFEPTSVKQRLDLSFVITQTGDPIPTLSEWSVVAMTLLLMVAGTIVFGRSHRLARGA